MEQNGVGSWREGGGLQVPSSRWLMLGISSLSVLVLHETLPVTVLMYGVRQGYGKRRRDLDLGCTDEQPQSIVRYLEDGYGLKCTDKGVKGSEEGSR